MSTKHPSQARLVVHVAFLCSGLLATAIAADKNSPKVLAGTAPLTVEGDLASHVVRGVDRFLLRELKASLARRQRYWDRDTSSTAAFSRSVAANRKRFRQLLGVTASKKSKGMQRLATIGRSAEVGRGVGYRILAVRWQAFQGVHAEGLLLQPLTKPLAHVVAIGDCQHSPEMLTGMATGIRAQSQFARRLAESGCQVLVPVLIDRDHQLSIIADGQRRSNVTHREILYRSAYQMGRNLIGYEVKKVLAAVDWFKEQGGDKPVGVIGYGEGGLLALYSAAIDQRILAAGVSGYFNSRQQIWQEPIDRNIFGLLREFGDAEIASLVSPRRLVIEACRGPKLEIPPGGASAPARLDTAPIETVRAEFERARKLVKGAATTPAIELIVSDNGNGVPGSQRFLQSFLRGLGDNLRLVQAGGAPRAVAKTDPRARHRRQFHELAEFSQRLVDRSPLERNAFLSKLERTKGIEAFTASTQSYRSYFRDEIVGNLERPMANPKPRSRLLYDEPKLRGYEILLDVFPDVQLYGILLLPKDLRPGERRPVVVCQHGLEGRAQSTIAGDQTSYRDFAARLARRGFVTFSPQHLYRGGDRFRSLQRKANPIKLSLFSIMVAQHRQLLRWLSARDFVDPKRIAFYGISYGGKSAMRIPALLDGYCLSICSSDFSDWIWRTVSRRFNSGYLAHSEYEIFEFNLGNTFNYAEMTALICPRPFMVERFHHHGSAADRAAAEFGKVRLLYENLGILDRVEMAYFGNYLNTTPYSPRRTFDFLHRHLRWPKPQ